MTVKCPKCTISDRLDVEDCGFESRGRDGTRLVFKCGKCKSGMWIGFSSDLSLQDPETIPDRIWFDMESIWHNEFSSSKLTEEDKIELGLLFHSLFGFSCGYARLFLESRLSPIGSPEQSFYLNSLRTMCVSFFIGTSSQEGDVNVRDVVRKHGLSHLLEPIDGILTTRLGSIAFEDILRRFRNKHLMHELFQLRPLENIYDRFDLRDDKNWAEYNQLEGNLFKETVTVFYKLREMYPEAWMNVGYVN